ncbi:Ras-related protein Rab-5C [Tritrichomonas foetus]|uniref:Ras-related protein Rab-5C n=1 Tax=Tritrichomonas foetus TaxID=1144522 RepID=A0A1J4K8F9_9EUKA|nr:Ras-related protein Rab-5C [Tritrichomonas foetus]|eukprot:OHT07168.1 Ras-related protein Rab-5C [Tritrichomonas foetus]
MITQEVYKVVLCGNTQAGKTSILQRYTTGRFDPYTNPTVGADFISHTVYSGDREFKMHIWDTAGQEQYQAIGTLYFRSTVLAIIVYDVTSSNSLESTQEWVDRMHEAEKNAIVVVFGNKVDLVTSPNHDVEEWCKENDYQHFFVSALTGEKIQESFSYVSQTLANKYGHKRSTSVIIESPPKEQCC